MEGRRLLRQAVALLLFGCSSLFIAIAFPLCTNLEAPVPVESPRGFCSSLGYNKTSCCDNHTDTELMAKFQSLNVADVQCSNFLQEILCSQCDPFSAFLFGVETNVQRPVPFLCNSSTRSASISSYCSRVWSACKDASIQNSPFATPFQDRSSRSQVEPPSVITGKNVTLSELWRSQHDFCTALGGSYGPGKYCYDGNLYTPPVESARPPPKGICFERIDTDAYLNMIPYPDGSNRAFLASQDGKIWLADVPEEGSGKPLSLNKTSPFLDISDRVMSTGEFGLLGLAFHPNFKENGRFFVSYSCDKMVWPDCAGQCACNADVGCMLSQLGPDAGSIPCQYSSIIAEYSANSSRSSPSQELAADPYEVRRIFTMGLPYTTHHAGQILFGAEDNYLYFMMGDGGSSGDPFNFSQNKKSLLGKILRFDIDKLPDSKEISESHLWGNYSVPPDNPFVNTTGSRSEIWAYGLRNPWRCSFDALNPTYFYCADVGQELYEEVNLISRGGNYGWRVYEGPIPFTPSRSPGGSTNVKSIQPIFPILGYEHKSVNSKEATASITGGFVSRTTTDACLYGRYIYADLYGTAHWAAVERPLGSGNYSTTLLSFNCSDKSPLPCQYSGNDRKPNIKYVLSYGEDNNRNLYLLSSNGVYKVSNPEGCNYACKEELPVSPSSTPLGSPPSSPSSPSSSEAFILCIHFPIWSFLVFSFLLSLFLASM